MSPERTYFLVPFAEKDEAKRLGARWDPRERYWYAPDPRVAGTLAQHWRVLPESRGDYQLEGEDRDFAGNELFVDLVPTSCWFTNVRYCIAPAEWEWLSREIRDRAGRACECCSAEPGLAQLDAHERWDYDEASRTQTLKRLICLCKDCHETTHFGYAYSQGRAEQAKAHLRRVRGFSEVQALGHIRRAYGRWDERNKVEWTLDLSIITNSGIRLAREVIAKHRRDIAMQALGQEKTGVRDSGTVHEPAIRPGSIPRLM